MAPNAEAGRRTAGRDRPGATLPVIVVGLDGSASSWDAFCWAVGEAARINAKVVAVYAIPPAEMGTVAAFGVLFDYAGVEHARQETAGELKDQAAHRANELGVALSFVTVHGDATHSLTDVARDLRANLVVVDRSAKAWHRLAGSLSHRLTSRSDAPVVVVVP